MRIAIGQLMEESNTFVPQRADLAHFRANQLSFDDEVVTRLRGTRAEEGGLLDTPGPSTASLARLRWRHLSRPLFPFDDDFEPAICSTVGPARRGGGQR